MNNNLNASLHKLLVEYFESDIEALIFDLLNNRLTLQFCKDEKKATIIFFGIVSFLCDFSKKVTGKKLISILEGKDVQSIKKETFECFTRPNFVISTDNANFYIEANVVTINDLVFNVGYPDFVMLTQKLETF